MNETSTEATPGAEASPAETGPQQPQAPGACSAVLHGATARSAIKAALTEASQISTHLSALTVLAGSEDLPQNERELVKEELRAWTNLGLRRLGELRLDLAARVEASFDCHPPAPLPPVFNPPAPQAPSGPPTTNFVPGPGAPGSSVPEGGTLPGSPGQIDPGTPGSLPPGAPGQTDPTPEAAAKREYGAPSPV